jgi:hypothetical protein
MTDRAVLTAQYLDLVRRSGAGRGELLSVMPRTGLLWDKYRDRFLSRPLFLGRAERDQLNEDLQHVRTALLSLPGALFGADLAAFAQACGLTGPQTAATLRSQAGQVTQLVRADLYPEPAGLRLLEYNMGSAVGGVDNPSMCRAMLRHPLLRDFAREHQLGYVDTMREQTRMIFAETGRDPGSYPTMAVTSWPDHYQRFRPFLHRMARRWRTLGLDTHACHIGQLQTGGGRVRLRGRPVDIIFRIFLTEHLLTPQGPDLIGPLLDAAADGQVAIFTPLDADLYGSKIPLAMLSDDAHRHLFTPAQLAAFDRVLPWTRVVRPGPVALEDGRTVDLLDYAAGHAEDLVLKPALAHGGMGVLAGWHPATSPQAWRAALRAALDAPSVLQRRIRPAAELCPGAAGEVVPWTVTWGVFTSPAGYGGVFARAYPEDSGRAIAQAGTGLIVGCCLTG